MIDHALPVAAVELAGHARLDVESLFGSPFGEPVDHDLVDDLVAPVESGVGLVRAVRGVLEIRGAAAGSERERGSAQVRIDIGGMGSTIRAPAAARDQHIIVGVVPRRVADRNARAFRYGNKERSNGA